MSKYNFKNVRRMQTRINQEVIEFKKNETNMPIEKTIIPKLFETLYELDEPAWEESIAKHKNVILGNN